MLVLRQNYCSFISSFRKRNTLNEIRFVNIIIANHLVIITLRSASIEFKSKELPTQETLI